MEITFNYPSVECGFPAPFVYVRLSAPGSNEPAITIPAIVDSGADRTVLPLEHADALRLGFSRSQVALQGFTGAEIHLPVFFVQLAIGDFPADIIGAVFKRNELHGILGRDVLNRFRVELNGPKRKVTFAE